MKNAKDYIREDGPGQRTITSLAYWLTPEGINQITAQLLQNHIDTDSDANFAEAFDGASKEEAREFLERWELCYLPYWSGAEVALLIKMCGGRSDAMALRAITLAQLAGELPQVFTPREGVEWLMARGYLVNTEICELVGAAPGIYGHPHNALNQPSQSTEPSTVGDEAPSIQDAALVESKSASANTWDEHALRKLLSDYNQPSATQETLAKQYGVSRSFIGRMLEKARVEFGPKKATGLSPLAWGSNKK